MLEIGNSKVVKNIPPEKEAMIHKNPINLKKMIRSNTKTKSIIKNIIKSITFCKF